MAYHSCSQSNSLYLQELMKSAPLNRKKYPPPTPQLQTRLSKCVYVGVYKTALQAVLPICKLVKITIISVNQKPNNICP